MLCTSLPQAPPDSSGHWLPYNPGWMSSTCSHSASINNLCTSLLVSHLRTDEVQRYFNFLIILISWHDCCWLGNTLHPENGLILFLRVCPCCKTAHVELSIQAQLEEARSINPWGCCDGPRHLPIPKLTYLPSRWVFTLHCNLQHKLFWENQV